MTRKPITPQPPAKLPAYFGIEITANHMHFLGRILHALTEMVGGYSLREYDIPTKLTEEQLIDMAYVVRAAAGDDDTSIPDAPIEEVADALQFFGLYIDAITLTMMVGDALGAEPD